MNALLSEIEQRWQRIFTALAEGSDVTPSLRLRTEGLMEAAVLTGLTSPTEITQQMDDCYHRSFGRSLEQDFDAEWQGFYPFPQIPAMGKRAPVYPSTAD